MFDELVKEVKKLFSSKSNGGRLVYKLTDRLHSYKQALLAISIVILLGYSQFRDHFECQGKDGLSSKVLTNFCWTNGTTTIGFMDQAEATRYKPSTINRYVAHVGIQFTQTLDGRYKVINHNYMRSLWALLILIAICSFIAQRWWALIFENNILKALLQLPGHEKMCLVERAQELRPYDRIIELSKRRNQRQTSESNGTGNKKLDKLTVVFHSIDAITGEQNEHNHLVDYYPNQLIYLLLAMKTTAYKLSGLKLRRKLITYSICSFLLTLMQFLLPLFFIGPEYTYYGLYYVKIWLRYTLKQIIDPRSNINTIDYELSSYIFPTSTSCEYSQYGFHDMDRIVVQCTVPINEICGKLFVLIWWFTVVNIFIELYSLIKTIFCSLNFNIIRWSFGRKVSPRTRQEANVIATFRYQRAMLLHKLRKEAEEGKINVKQQQRYKDQLGEAMNSSESKDDNNNNSGSSSGNQPEGQKASTAVELSERDLKLLEAEGDQQAGKSKSTSRISLDSKSWYLWCLHDVFMFLSEKSKQMEPGKLIAKNKSPVDEDGFKELREDMNIYYLMELMYLRLNCSRKKLEQIIHMSSEALNSYLESIHQVEKEEEEEEAEAEVPDVKVVTGV